MSNNFGHSSHLVNNSPWPILSSIFTCGMFLGAIKLFNYSNYYLMMISLIMLMFSAGQWWRDVSREGSYEGEHSFLVSLGLRWGMVLFILSEVMFFFSFFWAYFHMSISPDIELGGNWPPMGIKSFNPFDVPLLNTIILLSSGVSVTWSHHSLIEGDFYGSLLSLLFTLILGFYFSIIQAKEYWDASFNISDSVFGSTFFIATGFHGLHVLVGSLFLLTVMVRMYKGMLSPSHCFGFEAAAWYWHFVDVVWLFLFIWVYWWSYSM